MPVIRDVLAAFGIAVVGADGYEADDVIGTLSKDAGMPVDVVTGDRDLFQLVDDDAEVRILYIARGVGRHERVTNAVVQEKYGIDGRQYADFAALRGDASDGLPGVNGIGEKTAATLLQRFGDIPGLRAAAADPDSNIAPSPRRKIVEAGDYPEVAAHVTRVARDIDLGQARPDAAAHPARPRPARRALEHLEPREPDRPAGRDAHQPPLTVEPGSRRAGSASSRASRRIAAAPVPPVNLARAPGRPGTRPGSTGKVRVRRGGGASATRRRGGTPRRSAPPRPAPRRGRRRARRHHSWPASGSVWIGS